MGYLLRSFPAKPYGDGFKTAQEVIRISSKPVPPPSDRRIICCHTKGSLGGEHGFDAFTAMPLVGYQDIRQFMVNAPAHLAAKPPYSENNFVSFAVNIFSLPAANHG